MPAHIILVSVFLPSVPEPIVFGQKWKDMFSVISRLMKNTCSGEKHMKMSCQ